MDFEYSDKVKGLRTRVERFMQDEVYPNEEEMFTQIATNRDRWQPIPLMEKLKAKALATGLWNLFLPESEYGAGLTNLEYAPICEVMGRSPFAPEVFNCSAPDTGNMEVLVRYGTPAHKKQWLEPLLAGEIRSAFAMTEIEVASSDATNVTASIRREGDDYVINGRKWFTSGVLHPNCRIMIVMGKSNPNDPSIHRQQSDSGSFAFSRVHDKANVAGVWLRRSTARPRRGGVRQRSRTGGKPSARRGTGI